MKTNKQHVFITGGTGLLGKALIESGSADYSYFATYCGDYVVAPSERCCYHKLNLLDATGYKTVFDAFKPTIVIHTASIGSPDYAEANKEITNQINVGGTKMIVELCEKHGARLIYVSSNGIFDGENAPYDEKMIPNPINYYGKTKLQGEMVTKAAKIPCAIVRPILMYGINNLYERSNIVTSSLVKLAKGEKVFAYDDVYSNPLLSNSCAEAIWKIIDTNNYELFHIAGKDRVSIYGLILKAAEVFGHDPSLVNAVQQGYFNELVPRPRDTSYNTAKMENILKIMPLSLEAGLKIMKKEMLV